MSPLLANLTPSVKFYSDYTEIIFYSLCGKKESNRYFQISFVVAEHQL